MSRYIPPHALPDPPPTNSKSELHSSLFRIVTQCPPTSQFDPHAFHGLYSGPTSIAYLFHHLSITHPQYLIQGKTPYEWSTAYLLPERPRSSHRPAVTQSNCGIINETLVYHAVSAAHTRDNAHITLFLDHIPAVLADGPPDKPASNEWLYGRAGTLYLLRLLRSSTTADDGISGAIDNATTAIVSKILCQGPPWPWHGKEYLGAVHGTVGILTQILLSDPNRTMELQPLLKSLLGLQTADGNWPSSIGSTRNDLVQFCHGAPGFVISLSAIRPFFSSSSEFATSTPGATASSIAQEQEEIMPRIDAAIARGRSLIAERGLLVKKPCLCHGALGNALAFENGDQRKEVLMYWTQQSVIDSGFEDGWFVQGEDEWGLFCGEAGRAWAWLVMVEKGEGLIGYSDL